MRRGVGDRKIVPRSAVTPPPRVFGTISLRYRLLTLFLRFVKNRFVGESLSALLLSLDISICLPVRSLSLARARDSAFVLPLSLPRYSLPFPDVGGCSDPRWCFCLRLFSSPPRKIFQGAHASRAPDMSTRIDRVAPPLVNTHIPVHDQGKGLLGVHRRGVLEQGGGREN